jgi:6-phosphogluconolactonase
MPSQPEIRILNTSADLFQAAANEFAKLASDAVSRQGRFCVALSGGSTPKGLYALLATMPSIPWDKVCFFWGDERHVPPDSPESNYRMANETLLAKISAHPENVFRIYAEEKNADVAARAYEQTIRTFFHLPAGEFPRFDLILLGTGPEGHAASLFPGSSALEETTRLVVANWVDKFHTYRITFTLPVLNRAACVLFLVSGADKAPIVHEVLENPRADLPAQKVRPIDGRLIWMLDRPAASALLQPRAS